jgi:hypothetical protein
MDKTKLHRNTPEIIIYWLVPTIAAPKFVDFGGHNWVSGYS